MKDWGRYNPKTPYLEGRSLAFSFLSEVLTQPLWLTEG